MIDNAPGVPAITGDTTFSPSGVRYFDGQINISNTDLSSAGFGSLWGQSRSWSNGTPPSSSNGNAVIDVDRPYLIEPLANDSFVEVISSATNARFFNLSGGTYAEQFFLLDKLVHNTSTGEFVFTDSIGNTIRFFDFTAPLANQRGQFKSCSDPKGNTINVTSWTSDGKVAEAQRNDPSTGITESLLYTYLVSPDPNAGVMASTTLRRQVNGGAWTTVRVVNYDYYDGTSNKPFGNLGDLRTATILDGNNNVIDTMYYRYYTSLDAGTTGYVHGLKYYFSPQSYARLAADISNPLTATDAQVAPYADDYFEFDPYTQRVTKAVVQGAGCSVCTGGQGTFTYSYTISSNSSWYNSWYYKTVETLPDGSTNTVYANYVGETMLDVFQNGGQKWETFYEYDSAGRIILKANPSAVTGYNEAFVDLLDQSQLGDYGYLSSYTGLIEVTDYYTSTTATETTSGGAAGYYQDTKLEQGKSGAPILQASSQYFAHNVGGFTIYPVATSTVYRNTDGTGAETTSYSYTWFSGTTQMQSMTGTKPVISAAQNGPGVADVVTTIYDSFERILQTTDGDGFVNTFQYDQGTGALVQKVIDSGTGHLNLTTTTIVDALGRPTKVTDPNGNVTYTVYNDANHEVRLYPGWNGSTTTGPTQVTREDRAHDPSYVESFTMSVAPHLTNGQPDGTEPYAFLQTLSRTLTSRGGQVMEKDAYFNLGGIPYSSTTYLGTSGVNYYPTLYTYDTPRGWPTRVLLPTGTINRTVYDPLGRVVSTWIGTNDTPAAGSWSPSNNTAPSNMVQVTVSVFDGGSAGGDSNLTQSIQYPGFNDPPRVTLNFYDWRNRLVESKQGVQPSETDGAHRPVVYYQLDNRGEIVTTQRYDGDGVTITAGGVPSAPSASLLRAQTTTAYDDQGRVYQTNVYSVDQSQGTVSANSLVTNTWYNHRGLVVKVAPPGAAATKTSYDGAGRPTVVYTTDAYGDSTWNDAGTVSSNNDVLGQTETTYDNDGNAILVTSRNRFDNETQGGPLANPTTHPYARVYYVANYFDAANRLTDSANVGTNGGAAYTRPSTVPARSDTVLVTSTGYKADAVQQVVITGSPTGGVFNLNFGGQITLHMAYNVSAATMQANLQALSTIGSGNVLVSGPAGGPWQVRFSGALAGMPEPELGGNGSAITGGTLVIGTTSQGGDTGRVQSTTDPRGLISKTDYDLLARQITTIQNFVAFAPSNTTDQTTQYTYDGSNHTLTLTAVLPGNVLERTQYSYGVTGPVISSNDLLATVTYPATGQTSTERLTYDALGEVVSKTDRTGSLHVYTFDVLGRKISDAVTILGSGVDGSVRRLDTAYDTGGRPFLYTSYADPAGTLIVNQVQQVYNGLGQLITEYQSHAGAVNTSTTANVQYAYSFVSTSGGPNHSRLVSMTYPNGRVLYDNYNAGVDGLISRISSLSESQGTIESYAYLGLNTVVQRSQNFSVFAVVNMTYTIAGGNPDGGDKYTGLDRFGRVVEERWVIPGANIVTDDFVYSYDRDGNRLSKFDNVTGGAYAEGYSYDNFNQLTSFTRGSHSQNWSLDPLGNWSSFTNDGTTQTRSFNNQNQITALSGATTPTYDNNGNTLIDDTGKTYTYDAWNRLVKVVSPTSTVVYSYDFLGRRLNSSTNTLYYSSSWQVIEDDGTFGGTYVFAPMYVDALVERDSSNIRFYVQQDANWNVTAVVFWNNGSPLVQEHYVYDPYGKVSYYDAAWNSRPGSAYNWIYLFQGGRYDGTSGLYNFRNRDLSPTLGRWMQQDPVSYSAGDINIYRFVLDNPIGALDFNGLLELPSAGLYSSSPSTDVLTIGGGFNGTLKITGCSDSQSQTLAAATAQSCQCVQKAADLIKNHWDQVLKNYPQPSAFLGVLFQPGTPPPLMSNCPPSKLLPSNRDWYLRILNDALQACKGGTIKFACSGGGGGANAGTPFFPVPGPLGIRWIPHYPIYIYPPFWSSTVWPQPEIITHEFGRLFGGIYGQSGVSRDNIGVWDTIVRVLCRDYGKIVGPK
jgi:RHS repeat-associated protein